MKNGLLIAALLCFSGLVMAQNPEAVQKNDSVVLKGVHPYDPSQNQNGISQKIAHWSLIPHIGFNVFDGDFSSELKHAVAVPSAGLAVEYNFTPNWNVGLEYMYSMIGVRGREGHADTLLLAHMHKAGAYVSLDFMNLFFPRAQKKIVSILPYVGGGAAFYRRAKFFMDNRYYDAETGKTYYPTHSRGNTLNYVNTEGNPGPDVDKKYTVVGYIQAGVNVEFNLNRTLALGVRANYTYFTSDYVDGRGYHRQSPSAFASKNNDGMVDVTLNMRIRLAPITKSHARNMPSYEYYDEVIAGEEIKHIVHDTVIIHHDTVIIRENNTYKEFERERDLESYYYVYFANNKASIDDKGLITIQQVAERLQEDTTLYAVITGYCDNTGSSSLNYALGDKRAENVMDELIAEHGISTEHLYAMGVGKLVGRRSQAAYGPNRRASIRLVDKETFDRMKLNLEDKRTQRIEDEVLEKPAPKAKEHMTVPLAQSARPAKVNTYKQRTNETVTTDKSTTLSRLARQYYNNTYCWVYIYIANKEKISNPNALTAGMKLIIPELTEKEMQITKDESLVLYGNARQTK